MAESQIKSIFSKIWEWLKGRWVIIAIVLVLGVILFGIASKTSELSKVLEETNKKHKKEIEELISHHDRGIKARDEAIENYHKSLLKAEEEYQAATKELENRKTQTIIKIIRETGGNPDELAKKLSEATGFKVVPVKE